MKYSTVSAIALMAATANAEANVCYVTAVVNDVKANLNEYLPFAAQIPADLLNLILAAKTYQDTSYTTLLPANFDYGAVEAVVTGLPFYSRISADVNGAAAGCAGAATSKAPEESKAPEATSKAPEESKAPEATSKAPEESKAPEVTSKAPEESKAPEATATNVDSTTTATITSCGPDKTDCPATQPPAVSSWENGAAVNGGFAAAAALAAAVVLGM